MGKRCRFVEPDTVRLYLVEVHRRAHKGLLASVLPSAATKAERQARSEAIAIAEARLAEAEADGAYIDIRKSLTAGEQRARFARMSEVQADGNLRAKRLEIGLATVLAYLLDWSLTDRDGRPVTIRGLSPDELAMTLDSLDPDTFAEILEAITTHEDAEAAARMAPFRESALSAT